MHKQVVDALLDSVAEDHLPLIDELIMLPASYY